MDDRRNFRPHPELDCVRGMLSADLLAAVGRRARDVGVGGGRVLAMCGLLSEDDYLRAVARQFDIPFDTLESVARADCPMSDAQLVDAYIGGMLVFRDHGRLIKVVVPRALTSRRVREDLRKSADYPHCVRITSDGRLFALLRRCAGAGIADKAIDALARRYPAMSAMHTRRSATLTIALTAVVLVMAFGTAPQFANAVIGAILATLFLAWAGLRLWSAVAPPDDCTARTRCRDGDLPTYTIVAALRGEANMVGRLVAALDRLDYPALGSKCTN